MHEHKWELEKQQLDLGINRMFYACDCGEKMVTEFDLITEKYCNDPE